MLQKMKKIVLLWEPLFGRTSLNPPLITKQANQYWPWVVKSHSWEGNCVPGEK